VGAVGVVTFLFCLALEHLLHLSIDPTEHEVSEYARASAGWVMTVGFLAWAISLTATGWSVRQRWQDPILTACLFLAAAGLVLVASFATETSAGTLPPGRSLTTTGVLHDLGSGLTTLSLLSAAIVSAFDHDRRTFRRRTLLLVGAVIVGSIVLLAVGPAVGGLRQRLGILGGCAWQLMLLGELAKVSARPTEPRGSASC
jgi:MFS family permease